MILKGPTDADHYRVKVGRYGDRWYTDPLPAAGKIEATDEVWPSISTVKKASGQDWSFVSIKRIADAEPQRLEQIAKLPTPERYDAMTSINKRGLGRAAERGTNVHLYAEALLRGTTPPLMGEGMPGYEYLPAVDEFFAQYQPKLYAAEYPVIHRTLNGVGYGGTPDGIIDIGGELYGIDWKTRTETSDHGAYPEEGAQIAAGAFAEYMIVEDADGNAVRRPVPQLAGGLIISIKPDGCKVFPIDLATAWNHWEAMHAWWCARRNERLCVGKPWAPGKRQAPMPRTTKKNDAPTTTVTVAPDEGPTVDVGALRVAYEALSDDARKWIGKLATEARQAHAPFNVSEAQTERRAGIMGGLVAVAGADDATGDDLDDVVRAVVRFVTGEEAAEWPSTPCGAAVGLLGAEEATMFAATCRTLGQVVTLAFRPDGKPTVVEVAA